ncbi:thioredoxin domain-containing protein 11 [Platysternon megacephalum]|uniref:Thioredoxin domain-containing protein 11 n=1 Tax=Platysternon megacephalum TaxID=55544 RepID=A0A4D9DUJ7_9SAUR|nr:thioredoxin domain-containing protein 11 [Platysternon megacephalum]
MPLPRQSLPLGIYWLHPKNFSLQLRREPPPGLAATGCPAPACRDPAHPPAPHSIGPTAGSSLQPGGGGAGFGGQAGIPIELLGSDMRGRLGPPRLRSGRSTGLRQGQEQAKVLVPVLPQSHSQGTRLEQFGGAAVGRV